MAVRTAEQRKAELLEKQAKIRLEIKALASQERAERRKMETRGLVILGALAKAELEKGGKLQQYCAAKVTRQQDIEVLHELGWLPVSKAAPAPAAGAAGIPIPTMVSPALAGGQLRR